MGAYQKWLMSNLAGLMAAAALICAIAAGLFVGIAQVRCTLLEEDVAKLKGRLTEATESLRAEQDTNHKAVLGVVNETVKRWRRTWRKAGRARPKEPAADEPSNDPAKEPQ